MSKGKHDRSLLVSCQLRTDEWVFIMSGKSKTVSLIAGWADAQG